MTSRAWRRSLPPLLFAVLTVTILWSPEPAAAGTTASPGDPAAQALAERYSPIVKLQEASPRCDDGEQFQPTDVEAVLGDQQVALRGPWRPPDLVKTQPNGKDISPGFPGHFLDFPGDPAAPTPSGRR